MDDDLYKYIYRSVWLIILPQRFIIGKNFPINSKISIDNDKDIPESSNEIQWITIVSIGFIILYE